jgi:hypothetical protein
MIEYFTSFQLLALDFLNAILGFFPLKKDTDRAASKISAAY